MKIIALIVFFSLSTSAKTVGIRISVSNLIGNMEKLVKDKAKNGNKEIVTEYSSSQEYAENVEDIKIKDVSCSAYASESSEKESGRIVYLSCLKGEILISTNILFCMGNNEDSAMLKLESLKQKNLMTIVKLSCIKS